MRERSESRYHSAMNQGRSNDHTLSDNTEKSIFVALRHVNLTCDVWIFSSWSVICARGREAYDHIGNRRLRVLVDNSLDRYEKETSKFGKSLIVNTIIESVRESCRDGGSFVKKVGAHRIFMHW